MLSVSNISYQHSYQNEYSPTAVKSRGKKELTPEEKKRVEELKERDAEVRRHEQAHIRAGRQYVRGGAEYEYEKGPDGNQYAVSGEVNLDTSPIPDNPEATIQKAETIKRAALAPEEPSGQDRKVAAEADEMKREAQKELAEHLKEEGTSGSKISKYTAKAEMSGYAVDEIA